jgi:hypothetical protein
MSMRDYPDQHVGNVIRLKGPLSAMGVTHMASGGPTRLRNRLSCPHLLPHVTSELNTGTDSPVSEMSIRERLDQAMMSWNITMSGMPAQNGQRAPLPIYAIPTLLSDIRNDPSLNRPVRDVRAHRALEPTGDTSLRRLALMTPQEILALKGCGRGVLKRVIRELSEARSITLPEIVTGTGKLSLDKVEPAPFDDMSERILGDHYRPSPPRTPFQPRFV